MQELSNALPSKTIGQKVAENEGFEFKQNNSKKVAFFGIFRQKWQPSFNKGFVFRKNFVKHKFFFLKTNFYEPTVFSAHWDLCEKKIW